METGAVLTHGKAPWRVMIVDDEDLVRTSLTDLMQLAGYNVCGQAPNGYEAARLAPSVDPDIILMDLMMPDMDGIEALEIINATHPSCALVLSAYCNSNILDRVTAAGAQGYLMKPCRQADLVPAIETAIAQFQRSRLAAEAERVELHFERAWSHLLDGGAPAAAVDRALAGACQVMGHSAFAFVVRRGSRLCSLASRGVQRLASGQRPPQTPPTVGGAGGGVPWGPVDGPLGRALRHRSTLRFRLVGAPPSLTAVLSAPVSIDPTIQGCLCVFAPDGHTFSAREERLMSATIRSLGRLLQRLQAAQPRAWQRWVQKSAGRAPATMRRR